LGSRNKKPTSTTVSDPVHFAGKNGTPGVAIRKRRTHKNKEKEKAFFSGLEIDIQYLTVANLNGDGEMKKIKNDVHFPL
jgi:hypothetical protein